MDWSVVTREWPPHWLQREVVYRNYTWVRLYVFPPLQPRTNQMLNLILRAVVSSCHRQSHPPADTREVFSLTLVSVSTQAVNVLLRFAWTLYIPVRGPSTQVRAFIAACLEALRRIQWNLRPLPFTDALRFMLICAA